MAGSKPGERRGGRKRGTPNNRTVAREAEVKATAAKIEAALGDKAEDVDAHAVLMAIYKDKGQPMKMRLDAAKGALPYEKPALTRVDMTAKGEHVIHRVGAEPMSDDEWETEFTTAH